MEKFTREELLQQRETIINLLRSTNRDGVERLIKFLDKSQYFFCWGSFKHHKYVGGLAEHSLQVCKIALEDRKGNCDTNSIIIASLLHDICKVNYDFPVERGYYGHGTKSVQILEDYLDFKLLTKSGGQYASIWGVNRIYVMKTRLKNSKRLRMKNYGI